MGRITYKYTSAMPQTFEDPPLVEVVAELQWKATGQLQGGSAPIYLPNNGTAEEFYVRFGAAAFESGLAQSERLIPREFASGVGQPVYRYTRSPHSSASAGENVMWQVGPGLFSANTFPPYQSWEKFSQHLKKGVCSVIAARDPSESALPFSRLNLRYINSFPQRYWEGMSPEEFIMKKLKFNFVWPNEFQELIAAGTTPKMQAAFMLVLADGLRMNLTIAEGQVAGVAGVILDIQVYYEGDLLPTETSVMGVFGKAREVIHKAFFSIAGNMPNTLKLKQGV